MRNVFRGCLFAAVSVVIAGCSCSEQPQRFGDFVKTHAVTAVDSFIVDELTRNRVVMVGDMAHGQWVPRQTVIDALECWFRDVTVDTNSHDHTPRHLALVLESDSLALGKIERYMKSGDPNDVLDLSRLCATQFTTASMEFYWRLGRLRESVEEFNRTAPDNRRITFSILPGEATLDLDNWSFAKRDDYFFHVRDSLTAQRVASFLKDAPDSHFLVFYGQAHLQRGLVMKETDDKSEEGLYLATYLDSILPDSVVTIGQETPDYWGIRRDDFVSNTENYVLPLTGTGSDLAESVAGPRKYDAVIVHTEFRLYGTPILQIPSLNTARLCVSSLRSIVDTRNDFNRAYWAPALTYLEAVSGRAPHRLDLNSPDSLKAETKSWESWLASDQTDIVPKVADLSLYADILDRLTEAHGQLARQYDRQFMSFFPYAPSFQDLGENPTPAQRADQLRLYLETNSDSFATLGLVGLLWVGSEDEAREAERLLQERSGEGLSGRAAWSEWYRARGR